MGAVYLPLESQRRLIGLSRMALEEVVKERRASWVGWTTTICWGAPWLRSVAASDSSLR